MEKVVDMVRSHPGRRHWKAGALVTTLGALLLSVSPAWAHAVDEHVSLVWWQNWNTAPLLLLALASMGAVYAVGIYRLWTRAGQGRGVSRWQAASFSLAMVVLFIALVSPVDRVATVSFSMHMVQHLLLLLVAPPLLVLAAPMFVSLWALPSKPRHVASAWWKRLSDWNSPWYILWQPLLVWSLYAGMLWLWHLPQLWEAALRTQWIHDLQHIGFVMTAYLFWRVLLDPFGRLRLSQGVGVLYLFTTTLHGGALGILLTFSPQPWYGEYVGRAGFWNISALEDQQLAGVIMWMPAGIIYVVLAGLLFAKWLRESDGSTRVGY